MGIFFKIIHLFNKNKAHKELIELYSKLNKTASYVKKYASLLRSMQEDIIKKRPKKWKAGGMGLNKTIMIKEELIPQLKVIAEKTEERFFEVEERINEEEPFSVEEKMELKDIIDFLERIKKKIDINNLEKLNEEDKLRAIEYKLREIEKISKDFYYAKKYTKELARKVREQEISPLLRKIFNEANPSNDFKVFITKKELKSIEKEAERINSCNDPEWRIVWRRWWREKQISETDYATPIKVSHIDTTMRLFGKKKGIHICVRS